MVYRLVKTLLVLALSGLLPLALLSVYHFRQVRSGPSRAAGPERVFRIPFHGDSRSRRGLEQRQPRTPNGTGAPLRSVHPREESERRCANSKLTGGASVILDCNPRSRV